MGELVERQLPFQLSVLGRGEARALFSELRQPFKVDIIDRLGDAVDTVGIYRTGDFVDLCRGPHVPDSGWLSAVRLMRVAGVYWRGDERNEQLQRIYRTPRVSPQGLAPHLHPLAQGGRPHPRRARRGPRLPRPSG